MENYLNLPPRMQRFVEIISEKPAGFMNGAAAVREVKPQCRQPRQQAWRWLKMPRVAAAIKELRADAMERAGITREQVLLDAVEIKRRCMQADPVLDSKGEPTGEYRFDSAGANKANEFLGKYLGIAPDRHELTGKDGGPIKSETNAPTLADFMNTVTRIPLEAATDSPPAEPPEEAT